MIIDILDRSPACERRYDWRQIAERRHHGEGLRAILSEYRAAYESADETLLSISSTSRTSG